MFMCLIFFNILGQNISKLYQKNFEHTKSLCVKLFWIYILGQMFQKIRQEKKSELCQSNLISPKIFELHQLLKWQKFLNYIKWRNVPILSNCIQQKHCSVKIGSISFSSSSDRQKNLPSFRMPRYGH